MTVELNDIISTYKQAVGNRENEKHDRLMTIWGKIEESIKADMITNAQKCKLYVDYEQNSPMYASLVEAMNDSQIMKETPFDFSPIYRPIQNVGEPSQMVIRVSIKQKQNVEN